MKILKGVAYKKSGDKTISVKVFYTMKHKLYGKYLHKHTKYHAHDENNQIMIGDKVTIKNCRPLSKIKRWIIIYDNS